MAPQNKRSDEVKYDIIGYCIAYMTEKCCNERGLFRFAVSQTDVRLLQNQIANSKKNNGNGTVALREDVDPHLIAEVLQTTLKELDSPLLEEVYNDIINTGKQELS